MSLDHNHYWGKRAKVILRFGIGTAFIIQGIRTLSQSLPQKRETQTDDATKQGWKQEEDSLIPSSK